MVVRRRFWIGVGIAGVRFGAGRASAPGLWRMAVGAAVPGPPGGLPHPCLRLAVLMFRAQGGGCHKWRRILKSGGRIGRSAAMPPNSWLAWSKRMPAATDVRWRPVAVSRGAKWATGALLREWGAQIQGWRRQQRNATVISARAEIGAVEVSRRWGEFPFGPARVCSRWPARG